MARAFLLGLILFPLAAFAGNGATLCSWPVASPHERTCSEVNGDVLELAPRATTPMRVTIAESQGRLAEGAVVRIRGESRVWQLSFAKPIATRRMTLRLPSGEYELTAEAPHHRSSSKRSSGEAVTLFLKRHPVLSGAVRRGTGSPLANASIRDADGRYAAQSDPSGAFSIEIDAEWPRRLEISYPGLTTKLVAVPGAETDIDLPAVTLREGGSLAIDVASDIAIRGPIQAVLLRPDGTSSVRVKSSALAEVPGRASFEDLDAGDYQLLLEGSEPLQKVALPLRVEAGTAALREMEIEPIALTVRVRQGGKPVPGARIELHPLESDWKAALATDDRGEITSEAWQRGDVLFAVTAGGTAGASANSAPIGIVRTIQGSESATIELELPDRTITGRVIDMSDGSPVAEANVTIDSEGDDGNSGSMLVKTDANGRFAVRSAAAGVYRIAATSPAHLRSSPVPFRLGENDTARDIEVRIPRATKSFVRIVTPIGAPLPAAAVFAVHGGVVQTMVTADEQGRAEVPLSPSSPTTVYVYPKQGSFAVARLHHETREERRVVVRDGTASLRLRTTDTQGRPVANVRFVLRFDGELIPPEVASWAERHTGMPMRTGEAGEASLERMPPGLAELWPLRAASEIDDVLAATAHAAPAQIALKPGENVATMIFRKKQ